MPLYSYECDDCRFTKDLLRTVSDRDVTVFCDECGKPCKRAIAMPFVQMGKAGSVIDKGDKFWNSAEKKRIKNLNKRKNHEVEQAVYNDKEMTRKANNAVDNYTRTGNEDAAEQVEQNMERCKHGKARSKRIYSTKP